ncbi:MAG: hypothetical protein V4692_06235 [Bdellovibrionota bacterium]
MGKLIFAGLVILISGTANAKSLQCKDIRDSAYLVTIDKQAGIIEAFNYDVLVDSIEGKFVECDDVGADRGAAIDYTVCEFVPKGSKKSIGTLTIDEDGFASYDMTIDDRRFRGSCD